MYENISSTQFNVGKSVIIPLSNPTPQEWHSEIGCKILRDNETMVYLGSLIGYHVTPLQQQEFLLGKVWKHLYFWVNKSLSFAGRTVLLKHVLCAILVYQFMSMGLSMHGYMSLEGICKQFLCGKNERGQHKRALISWNKTARSKPEGGLGIEPFHDKSRTLKMRWISKLLLELEVIWVQFARCSIQRSLAGWPGCKTKRHWSTADGLLLDDGLHISLSLPL